MANFMLINHQVRDFNEWRTVYDSHLGKRVAAGLHEKYLLRDTDDPNRVILLFQVEDMDRARTFAASPDLRERMRQAGVLDNPAFHFLGD